MTDGTDNPGRMTQAQALFAVLAGGVQARRERVYYRDLVLRSSLYLVPHSDVGVAVAQLRDNPLQGRAAVYDVSSASAGLTLSFTSVRVDYTETSPDSLTSSIDFDIAMTFTGIAYPVYTETSPDSITSSIDFDIAMTYTQILFPVYTETSSDSITSSIDFDIAMTKS